MRPTRRGIVVVAVVCIAALQGWLFGQRSLNYVTVSALAALSAGAFSLWRADPPAIDRSAVPYGFPGDRHEETITVEGSGLATVIDELPDGIGGEAIDRTVSLPVRIDRELTYRDRGRHRLEPVTIRQRDPLGLLATTVEFDTATTVTVYPEVFELDRPCVLNPLFGERETTNSESFDRLRKYRDGDQLRRIHWRSTAKRDELLVTDADSAHRRDPVHVAIEGTTVSDDLASAAGSFALFFLDAGYEVSLTLPTDRLASDRGRDHRKDILCALATADGETECDKADRPSQDDAIHETADVSLVDNQGTVIVHSGGETVRFEQLCANPSPVTAAAASVQSGGV